MTSQTSLSAFTSVKTSLPHRQREVLLTIKKLGGTATMHDVSRKMFRPLHTISGRFSELIKKGYIKRCGKSNSPNWPSRTFYRLVCFPADLTEVCQETSSPLNAYSGTDSSRRERGGK